MVKPLLYPLTTQTLQNTCVRGVVKISQLLANVSPLACPLPDLCYSGTILQLGTLPYSSLLCSCKACMFQYSLWVKCKLEGHPCTDSEHMTQVSPGIRRLPIVLPRNFLFRTNESNFHSFLFTSLTQLSILQTPTTSNICRRISQLKERSIIIIIIHF